MAWIKRARKARGNQISSHFANLRLAFFPIKPKRNTANTELSSLSPHSLLIVTTTNHNNNNNSHQTGQLWRWAPHPSPTAPTSPASDGPPRSSRLVVTQSQPPNRSSNISASPPPASPPEPLSPWPAPERSFVFNFQNLFLNISHSYPLQCFKFIFIFIISIVFGDSKKMQ